MKWIIALLLSGVTVFGYAHQDEANNAASGYDCEHPPADAVTDLPGLLGTVGRLVCLPGGPGIVANEGWSWRYTGSYFDVPMIVGYAHQDSAGMAPPFFFTQLSAQELTADEAARHSEDLAKAVETYRPEGSPSAMSVIEATNNYGLGIKAFLAMQSETNGWLIVCTPECRPDYVILINKLQRN